MCESGQHDTGSDAVDLSQPLFGPIRWRSFLDQQLNADTQPSGNCAWRKLDPSLVSKGVAGEAC
jgi:hypothetical protein